MGTWTPVRHQRVVDPPVVLLDLTQVSAQSVSPTAPTNILAAPPSAPSVTPNLKLRANPIMPLMPKPTRFLKKTSGSEPMAEIVQLEYCVVTGVTPKSVSDVCAMTLAAIENIVATEHDVRDSSEAVAPKRYVEVPQAPHKEKRIRNSRFVKVSAPDLLVLNFARAC